MKISVTLRKKQNTPKTASLYLDIIRPNYKRQRKFLGLTLTGIKSQDRTTLAAAEEIRIKTLAALQRDVHSLRLESKIRLKNLIDEYIETKEKYYTINNFRKLLIKLEKFDQNSLIKKISSITPEYLEVFKKFLLEDKKYKVSKNTAFLYLTNLRTIFNYAVKHKYISKNPVNEIDFPEREKTTKEFLSIDELHQLETIENKTETLRAFLFSCYTGLRFSDVKKLKYNDIREGKIEVKQQKTKEILYIPLSNKAKDILKTDIYQHSGLVFKLPSGQYVNRHLKKLFFDAGMHKNKPTFHISRHTFATIGLTIGIDIETISKLLGHNNITTTQIYAKIVSEKINNAIEKWNQI